MVNVAPKFYHLAIQAYHEKDIEGIIKNSYIFLEMLKDLDKILATNEQFLLGVWLEQSKSIPSGGAYEMMESALYEYNARNQITLWGPHGEIVDYATRQWSGVVNDYYVPRWQLFFETLVECVNDNSTFNYVRYRKEFIETIGKPFTFDRTPYPTKPNGDTIYVAEKLYSRWRDEYNPIQPYWQFHSYQNQCDNSEEDVSNL